MSDVMLKRRIPFRDHRRAHEELREGEPCAEVACGKIPRISRLMVLAIQFDELPSLG